MSGAVSIDSHTCFQSHTTRLGKHQATSVVHASTAAATSAHCTSVLPHLLSSCCRGVDPCPGPFTAGPALATGSGTDAVGVLPPTAAGGCWGFARCCCCCSKKAGVSSAAAPAEAAVGAGSGGAELAACTGDAPVLGPRCDVVCFCCAALSSPCRPLLPPACMQAAATAAPQQTHSSAGREVDRPCEFSECKWMMLDVAAGSICTCCLQQHACALQHNHPIAMATTHWCSCVV